MKDGIKLISLYEDIFIFDSHDSEISKIRGCQSVDRMLIYNSNQEKIKWRVGETVNSHAFHACIHGFESRTRHHKKTKALYKAFFHIRQRVACGSI